MEKSMELAGKVLIGLVVSRGILSAAGGLVGAIIGIPNDHCFGEKKGCSGTNGDKRGDLKEGGQEASSKPVQEQSAPKEAVPQEQLKAESVQVFFQSLQKRISAKIKAKERLNSNTILMTLEFDNPEAISGLRAGYHFNVYEKNEEGVEKVVPYTQITSETQKGSLSCFVKVYYPTEAFPKGGFMSQHLDSLDVGSTIEVAGPRGKFAYLGRGKIDFALRKTQETFQSISLICGGTGLAPFLAILRKALADPEDTTKFTLIHSCKKEEDFLFRAELEEMEKTGRLDFLKRVTQETEPKEGLCRGRIDRDFLEEVLAKPSESHLIFYSGPKEFDEFIHQTLASIGHAEERIVQF
jgi:nitrate reductase (NAD(P)H)